MLAGKIDRARHLATADKLRAPIYFCDSRSPWQRGSNENTNGLLRDYFPKGVTLAAGANDTAGGAQDIDGSSVAHGFRIAEIG